MMFKIAIVVIINITPCNPLYTATSIDVNECDRGNGGCEQLCVNSEGSFQSICHIGFRLATNGRSCLLYVAGIIVGPTLSFSCISLLRDRSLVHHTQNCDRVYDNLHSVVVSSGFDLGPPTRSYLE